MNGYESGSRGMDEGTLDRISAILECDGIEIWVDAFNIFRFNYFRERAENAGVPVEEWVARRQQRPSIEQVREAFHSIVDKVWQLLSAVLAFLQARQGVRKPKRRADLGSRRPSPVTTKRKRATRFRQGDRALARGAKSRPKKTDKSV